MLAGCVAHSPATVAKLLAGVQAGISCAALRHLTAGSFRVRKAGCIVVGWFTRIALAACHGRLLPTIFISNQAHKRTPQSVVYNNHCATYARVGQEHYAAYKLIGPAFAFGVPDI
jgi:hypothetical protein